ncbi:hypothetical protein [Methylocaldum sp.]|uniref:hypothetical protein n=1 Tax=Methylocaldum sp. TaxID=1969727 RepID=UPI002D79C686|nr:hypothetical protein [Methylocaldum sp.]
MDGNVLKYLRKHSVLTRVLIPFFLIAWLVLPAAIVCETVFKQLHGVFLSACEQGDSGSSSHHEPALPDDCNLGLCLDAKTFDHSNHGLFDQKLEIFFAWVICWLILLIPPRATARSISPPPRLQRRRRVPLIYQFCTLLN